jgi:hypothetical protein
LSSASHDSPSVSINAFSNDRKYTPDAVIAMVQPSRASRYDCRAART